MARFLRSFKGMTHTPPSWVSDRSEDVAVLWGVDRPLRNAGYVRVSPGQGTWMLLTEEESVPGDRIYLWCPVRGIGGTEHLRVVARVLSRVADGAGGPFHVRIEPEIASRPLDEIVRILLDGDVGVAEPGGAIGVRDSYATLDDGDPGSDTVAPDSDAETAIEVAERSLNEPLPGEPVARAPAIRWRSIAWIAVASVGGVVGVLAVFRLLVWPFIR